MGPKVRTRGEVDEAPQRQLGFDLAIEGPPAAGPRELVPVTPAALIVPEPPSARAVEEAPPPAPRVLAVSELVRAARLTLENYFGEVRVEGEVSGFKRSGPGHLYFIPNTNGWGADNRKGAIRVKILPVADDD